MTALPPPTGRPSDRHDPDAAHPGQRRLSPPSLGDRGARSGRLLSRRTFLLGAGGVVIVAGGVSAWAASGQGSTSVPAAPGDGSDDGSRPPSTSSAPSASTASTASTASSAPALPSPDVPVSIANGDTSVVTPSDRVLVVVQLTGGNDALNTLVPTAGAYHDLRPTIALADDSLITIGGTNEYGLHPALAPLVPSLEAGRLGIVAGIGFPDPDRSHFAALDMWWSGAPDVTSRTGWLGRWLDSIATTGGQQGRADPAAQAAVLQAVGLGGSVPALLADTTTAIGVNDIARFGLPTDDHAFIDAWASMAESHEAARHATEVFSDLAMLLSAEDGAASERASSESVIDRLAVAAELIVSEPGVRVVHVTLNGFDTHAGQLDAHAGLLGELATGIASFRQRLADAGQSQRVLLITTSEFGRRAAENGSGGTDHGKAGVQFVVGDAVATGASGSGGTVFGTIDPRSSGLQDGDLRPVVDPRSMYASALDWLGADVTGEIADQVLGLAAPRLPFLAV
jgi:uncharacterized protein (DUF1501 family)